MHCPFCQSQETKVIDTRVSEDCYSIRRRRECIVCSKRFTTQESMVLMVVKRDGNAEPFNREKVVSGVRKACKGRPIDEEELKLLGIRVERDLRSRGVSEVKAEEVGLAILEPLRQLDEVAYMRFASVYQHFNSLDDYSQAIDSLKKARSQE
ncbi:transcriptional regulator NrdR [Alloscardovia sp. HMSC034E08]|uniref:transcriptional regulator NrdR n=1 Tax=Alloscardovia sp. HMSC034E08 TaxID=1739413 RepID=UPI0008B47578|nr:transcriptional regulator NrdR [Alloscardovia sp. HMSC034E08]OFQ99773.1 transcriptional regulator NrdR [Alloscardovia sp. HMSC034E08]